MNCIFMLKQVFKATLIFSFIFGPAAWSKELSPLTGRFEVSVQDAKALVAYEIESVWTFSDEGKSRLQYLKETYGASCSYVQRSLYRCKRFLNAQGVPDKIIERINNEWVYSSFTFSPAKKAELLYEGETVKEYLVNQLGEVSKSSGQEIFNQWRYFFGENDLEKVQAGVESPAPYSFVRKGNRINLIFSEGMTLDRFRFQVWTISLPFIK